MRHEVLAIDAATFEQWAEQVKAFLASGGVLDTSVEAAAKLIPARRSVGSVAVVPLNGFMTQKPTLMSMLFGGTSTEGFAAEVVAALRDPSIGAVVMAIDSPGGSVHGVPEAAAAIRGARGDKPLFAVANPMMASAALWLGGQADEVIGAPSSITGSVGAMAEHMDLSAALEKQGVKVEVIRYGQHKGEGHPAMPLDDESRAGLQAKVDYFGRMFEADLAKGRGISVEKVRSDFGQGATFTADRALAAGIIDGIDTLDEVIRSAANGRRPKNMRPMKPMMPMRGCDPAELALRARLAGVKLQ